jgi:SAM-dependent methyltransferase
MSYLKIAEHYDKCFKKHGDNHLGVDWPKLSDTLTRYEIMYGLVREIDSPQVTDTSILDFGCGLGHFYKWLKANHNLYPKYSGLDINESFYNHCSNEFPDNQFYLKDILVDSDLPNFDYVICNGVFTEKRELSHDEMFQFMKGVLTKLWDKTNKGISFNVMSKLVDWERDDLFHVSMDELGIFLKENLSRNFIIRNDYKLYEYTIYVYK